MSAAVEDVAVAREPVGVGAGRIGEFLGSDLLIGDGKNPVKKVTSVCKGCWVLSWPAASADSLVGTAAGAVGNGVALRRSSVLVTLAFCETNI